MTLLSTLADLKTAMVCISIFPKIFNSFSIFRKSSLTPQLQLVSADTMNYCISHDSRALARLLLCEQIGIKINHRLG